MAKQIAVTPAPSAQVIPRQADNEETVIRLWLQNRGEHTRRAYEADLRSFGDVVRKPLAQVTVGDLEDYLAGMAGLASATRARRISTLKSLLTYAQSIGFLPFNPGAAVEVPKVKNTLGERIVDEATVLGMIHSMPAGRNRAMIRLLYASGLRISELCGLKWRDAAISSREGAPGGILTVHGKGEKTRHVHITPATWAEVSALRGDADADAPIFLSREGGHLNASMVHRIIKSVAAKVGVPALSAHWLRHAHASHALDKGSPIHLVQATLGHASLSTTTRYSHAKPTESSGRFLAV